VSRSAALPAAAAVTLALIKFAVVLPGWSTPNTSWVILPMAPTGVVSVSPVTRHATSASANESSTATAVSQYGMPKVTWPSQASPISAMPCPPMNQDDGVSIAATGSSLRARPPNIAPRSVKARFAVSHCSATDSRLDVTMHPTPPQSVHCTRTA
jgi:hypothetical protein